MEAKSAKAMLPTGLVVTESKSPTDLSALWQKAFKAYNRNLGESASARGTSIEKLPKITDLQGFIAQVDEAKEKFSLRRHKGSRLDKLRTAVGEHLDTVQSVGDFVAQSAIASFPPAAAIWTVATFAIKVSQAQSADYDKLTELIVETGGFMKVLQIVEMKVPDCERYAECVTEVFTSLLVVFAIQIRYMMENRALTFFREAVRGTDQALADAYTTVRKAIDRLSRANGFRAVANTEDLLKLMGDLDMKLDARHEQIMMVFTKQKEDLEGILQLSWEQVNRLEAVDMMLRKMTRNAAPKEPGLTWLSQNSNASLGKHSSFRLVAVSTACPTDPGIQYREIENSFVKNSTKWLFNHDLYLAWLANKFPILWITGNAGIGKSFLAYAVASNMSEDLRTDPRKTVMAYYFFGPEREELRSVRWAFASIIRQIAATDSSYCEKIARQFLCEADETEELSLETMWRRYLASKFDRNSETELCLILDGIDWAWDKDLDALLAVLGRIQVKGLKIRALLTSRPDTEGMEIVTTKVVEVKMENISEAISLMVEKRCGTRRFSYHTRKKMVVKIAEKADGLLYVDRVLQELRPLGGRAVWKALDELPDDLNSLYARLLSRCIAKKALFQRETLRRLFTFVAFSVRLLDKMLRLDEEIRSDCADLLKISRALPDDSVAEENSEYSSSNTYITEFASDTEDEGSAYLCFRDRPIRTFVRTLKTRIDPAGIRIPRSQAHYELLNAAVEIICMPHFEGDLQLTVALRYAANYWPEHLVDVEIESATSEDVAVVLKCLDKIWSHHLDVARVVEEYCIGDGNDEFYRAFASDCVSSIIALGAHAGNSDGKQSSIELNESTLKIVESPMQLLHQLARGHIIRWYQQVSASKAAGSLVAAREALAAANSVPLTPGAVEAKDIERVANFFDDLRPTEPQSLRAVGLACLHLECHDLVLKYCRSSLERAANEIDRYQTMIALAQVCRAMANTPSDAEVDGIELHKESAHKYASAALEIMSAEDLSNLSAEVQSQRYHALIIRAESEEEEGDYAKAVETYEAAKAVWPESSGGLLGKVTTILDKNGEYAQLLNKVQSWALEDRLYWLALNDPVEYANFGDGANQMFQRAAKLSHTARTDTTSDDGAEARATTSASSLTSMIPIYEEMIDYMKHSACLRFQLAFAYRRVVGDDLAAKAILDALLNGDSCFDPSCQAENTTAALDIRNEFCVIVFEQFRNTSDYQEKMALIEEFEQIPQRPLGVSVGDYAILNDENAIILARMIRKVRPPHEFQAHMERVFQNCMTTLSDSIGGNDGPAMRILSKLLLCLDGLERDAQIAMAATYSVLDAALPEGEEDESYNSDEVGEAEGASSNGREEEEWEDEADEEEKDPPDEDLSDSQAWCNGNCGKTYTSWSEAGPSTYVCLICTDCDLCQECHDKRQALNRGDTSAAWRSFCGRDHEYLKCPMEGWRGVKDGVMTIGEERVEFKVWLQGLRTERWPAAWAEFWKGA